VNKLGGRLDYLVLNHIILLDLGVWTGSQHNLSLIDKVINVNFQSYVYLASHSLPHLEESKGSIVVVSSFAGMIKPVNNSSHHLSVRFSYFRKSDIS
jgi:NAD(P)-dependent dehydrogenase (short-subunit alcohol dehydrogenase family)